MHARLAPLALAALIPAAAFQGAAAQDAAVDDASSDAGASASATEEYAAPDGLPEPEVLSLHDGLLTIDTHVDIGAGYGTAALDPGTFNRAQVNLPSMRLGGLDAGFFIVYTPQGDLDDAGYAKAVEDAEEKYRGIVRMIRGYGEVIGLATTADEVESIQDSGRLVALIGIENAYPLGTTPEVVAERVAMWAGRGARYASITHFGHNQFGGSSNPSDARGDGEDPGLNDLGRALVTALNDHGIMVDISHVGPKTVADAMALSRAPVIASHSTSASVYDNPRGLTDDQLRAVAEMGGVVQITAFRSYVAPVDAATEQRIDELRERLGIATSEDYRAATPATLEEYEVERGRIRAEGVDVTLAQFLDHVDRAVEIAGVEHVGLSGDFDGGGGVEGWDGAGESANVTAAMLRRGYTEEDLEKIWGGNVLRVMREVEAAATKP